MKSHWTFITVCFAAAAAPLLLGFKAPSEFAKRLDSGSFLIVQEQRVRAYAQTLDRPKLLFIGGSSTFMAITPAVYSAELGWPVVNYGLSVNSGAEYIAEHAAELIHSGDVVVFAAEFVFFQKSSVTQPVSNPKIQARIAQLLPPPPAWVFTHASTASRTLLHRLEDPVRATLQRDLFGWAHPFRPRRNHYEPYLITADGHFPHTRPERFEGTRFTLHRRPEPAEVDIIKSPGGRALDHLVKICAERRATLAVMPPARVTTPEQRHDIAERIEHDWLERARELGATVLLSPGETTLALEFGFDSDYHMNDAGAEIIRQRLVPVLRQFLSTQLKHSP
jgi:hypothetical protein